MNHIYEHKSSKFLIVPSMEQIPPIHVGKIGRRTLFLCKLESFQYAWFFEETPTNVVSHNIEEAIRLAYRKWAPDGFRTLHCGFRYTLPERDEHGINALFYQMVASYRSPNGVYFDEELGGNCIVQFASLESRNLMKRLP